MLLIGLRQIPPTVCDTMASLYGDDSPLTTQLRLFEAMKIETISFWGENYPDDSKDDGMSDHHY
jgi:hypothetical protein